MSINGNNGEKDRVSEFLGPLYEARILSKRLSDEIVKNRCGQVADTQFIATAPAAIERKMRQAFNLIGLSSHNSIGLVDENGCATEPLIAAFNNFMTR